MVKLSRSHNHDEERVLNLSVQLAPTHPAGLQLRNPVMAASGTFGYGTEYADLVDIQQLGAIVCKGTTLEPREGHPQPRLKETAAGLLNCVGLQNIGVEALIREKAPLWAKWQVPVIVNIAAERVEDYATLSSRLDNVEGVGGIEINISCPNVSAGGMEFGKTPEIATAVTAAVREATSLPVMVKLTPSVTDIVEIAVAVAQAGAHTISLINTVPGMAIDVEKRKPFLGNTGGGLSGPAIKPIALHMVHQVSKAVDVPVVGCGGIASTQDALEFLMAGAKAIQIGTANFVNPRVTLDVLEGIEQFMEQEGVQDLTEIVGAAHS
jgi:dihydroorotate dehydrogenase (NAD+) catalytic subunit